MWKYLYEKPTLSWHYYGAWPTWPDAPWPSAARPEPAAVLPPCPAYGVHGPQWFIFLYVVLISTLKCSGATLKALQNIIESASAFKLYTVQ